MPLFPFFIYENSRGWLNNKLFWYDSYVIYFFSANFFTLFYRIFIIKFNLSFNNFVIKNCNHLKSIYCHTKKYYQENYSSFWKPQFLKLKTDFPALLNSFKLSDSSNLKTYDETRRNSYAPITPDIWLFCPSNPDFFLSFIFLFNKIVLMLRLYYLLFTVLVF